MKSKKQTKKLALNKITITEIGESSLKLAKGGLEDKECFNCHQCTRHHFKCIIVQ